MRICTVIWEGHVLYITLDMITGDSSDYQVSILGRGRDSLFVTTSKITSNRLLGRLLTTCSLVKDEEAEA